mmetsp:Transcript_806/g.1657  ORF Transcript_806/g.1657 Transcript_806/m.1657 type:complete len:86 (+) Transcript_806:600-857(+)
MVGLWTMPALDALKIAILYWGHHVQLMNLSRNGFLRAQKNAVMRSYRGKAIVCTTLTVISMAIKHGTTHPTKRKHARMMATMSHI